MDSPQDASNIYAPPRSHFITKLGSPSLRWRFWATCTGFALAAPAFFYGLGSVSGWLKAVAAVATWILAVYWILLPHLRHRSRSEPLDLTYIACVAIGFPVCTALAWLGLMAAVLVSFFLVSILA